MMASSIAYSLSFCFSYPIFHGQNMAAALLLGLFMGLLLLCHLVLMHRRPQSSRGTQTIPEPKGAWPIIGHLLLLDRKTHIYRTLGTLANEHGAIFLLRLGVRPTIVVNNWEAVKECFTENDLIFASRPSSIAGRYLGYNYAGIVFAPYGPCYRDTRKLAVNELLSSGRTEKFKHLRKLEVDMFIKDLYFLITTSNGKGGKVRMCEMLDNLSINIMSSLIGGKRYLNNNNNNNNNDDDVGGSNDCDREEAENFKRLIKELMRVLVESFVLSDVIPIPFYERLDLLGEIKAMKHVTNELDSIFQGWIDEHRRRRTQQLALGLTWVDQDFVDVMISALEQGMIPSQHDHETMIKATIQNLFIAGTASTPITVTWLLSLLLNNPCALKRAQDELDNNVGKDRLVEESDIQSLPFLRACVTETLRLYPPAPLGAPHEATKDCCVSGYHIKKGTRLLVNIWKLHQDPRIWINPEEFIPERFLDENTGSRRQDDLSSSDHKRFSYIPFGAGRRSCPGDTLALRVIQLTAARLLQGFILSTPMNGGVGMSEAVSFEMRKLIPLDVILIPRLLPTLYA